MPVVVGHVHVVDICLLTSLLGPQVRCKNEINMVRCILVRTHILIDFNINVKKYYSNAEKYRKGGIGITRKYNCHNGVFLFESHSFKKRTILR